MRLESQRGLKLPAWKCRSRLRESTEDVKSLAKNVQAKVQNALDVAAKLIPTIESATLDISVLKEEQLKDLPSLVSAVSANLDLCEFKTECALHRFA